MDSQFQPALEAMAPALRVLEKLPDESKHWVAGDFWEMSADEKHESQ